jgi:hypothetical protein
MVEAKWIEKREPILRKRVLIGTVKPEVLGREGKKPYSVVIKVEIQKKMLINKETGEVEDEKVVLSMVGSIERNEKDWDSTGQIQDRIKELVEKCLVDLKIEKEKLKRLLEIWDQWHSNDLIPCEDGKRWCYKPLPKEVIEFLKSL